VRSNRYNSFWCTYEISTVYLYEWYITKETLSKIDICVLLINGIGGTLLLLEMRTVLIWRLQKVERFTDLKVSLRNFSFMHYGLGFRHCLHTLYLTWNTLWYVEWSSRILEVASCVLWKKICRNIQNVSKEHSVLQGFILKWNYLE